MSGGRRMLSRAIVASRLSRFVVAGARLPVLARNILLIPLAIGQQRQGLVTD